MKMFKIQNKKMNNSYKVLIMGRFASIISVLLVIFLFYKCQNETEEPEESTPIEVSFEVTDPSETGKSDGSIKTDISGGSPPYNFLWSNGAMTKDIDSLSAGMYILTISDAGQQVLKDTVSLIDVVLDVDVNAYGFARIGDQIWMRQNLRVTHAPDSTDIESYVYDNDTTYELDYGRLYSWNVAMNGSDSEGAQGICPSGWHIPSDEEFKILEMHLGMTRQQADMVNCWRGSPVGDRLKLGGDSGYDARMAGRCISGYFRLLGQWEYMWTSTESGSSAWRRCLAAGKPTVGRYNTFNKNYGFSVRCVKDE